MSAVVTRDAPPGRPGASLDRVTRALASHGPGKRAGEWIKYHCPVPSHGSGKGDRDPSLGVLYDAAKGRTKVECFSGCLDTAVLDVIGLSVGDLFDEPLARSGGGQRSSNGLADLPSRRKAAPKKPTKSAAQKASKPSPVKRVKGELGAVAATYDYTDTSGSRVGRVLRYEPKDFRPQRWNPDTRRWSFAGFGPFLYRLPQVAAAIASGERVYLVEGEKDADTADRCGVVGTTNASGGGRGKFLQAHADLLRGGHITVVADRDKAGYEHAIEAQERLAGVAASVRVVQAAAGKDLTDHVEAGHDVDDLQEVDPAAALAEINGDQLPPSDPPPPGGDDRPPSGGDEVPNRLPEFIYRRGETVQIRRNSRGQISSYDTIWRCEVSTLDQLVDDNGDPAMVPTGGGWWLQLRRRRLDAAGEAERDDAGEQLWDEASIHLPAESVRDGSWHDHLPWPGVVHDLSQKGRTTALQAASLVGRMPQERAHRYTATGWRTNSAGQNMFVHAGGAITAEGSVPLPYVAIDGKIGVFRMSEPTVDQDQLREAVRDGLAPLVHLPGSIVAPLIGFAFRAIFGAPHTSLHLVGNPGSGKTSITRIAGMHWFAPDMRENGPGARKEVFSALDEVGDSVKGLLDRMSAAADLPVLVDDFKGPKGPAKLAQLQSAVWNGGDRTLGTRNGGHRTTGAPRCSAITTGETSSTGSSATRALTIRVESASLSNGEEELPDLMGRLERRVSRDARGTLGASFIQWVAGKRESLTRWIHDLEEESPYIDGWNRICARLEHDAGVRGRLVRTSMVCTSGWVALLTWLRSVGVLADDEAKLIWDWAMAGLMEQLREQDPSSVDGPRHMLDLVRSALLSGSCHLSSQQGGVPDDVHSARHPDGGVPYGWSPRTSVSGPAAMAGFTRDDVIWQARGDRIGILTESEVWLIPRMAMGAAKSIAMKADETFPHTSVSLGAAMAGRGWILANGAGDRSSNRRIASVQQRVWVMPRQILDGRDDDDPSTTPDQGTDPTVPLPPWLLGTDAAQEPAASVDAAEEPVTDGKVEEDSSPEVTPDPPENPASTCGEVDVEAAASVAAVQRPEVGDGPEPAADVLPATTVDERWLAAAAVVTSDELVLPDGTRVHLPEDVARLGQLAELATELRLGHGGGKHVLPSPGQLWLTVEAMARFGIVLPDDIDAGDPDAASDAAARAGSVAAAAAVAEGWRLSADDQLRVWTRIWRQKTDEQRAISVQLVLIPLVGAFDTARSLVADDPTPEALARRAQMVADSLGVTWGASGGVTGLALLRQLRPPRSKSARTPLAAIEYVAPPPPMVKDPGRVPNTALLWCRTPSSEESGRQYVHGYDANAMYLAAQGATEVGVGEPEHHPDGAAFSAKIAGLWRIQPGEVDDWRLPDITRPAGRLPGTTGWYTTPVIRYLVDELGQSPEILEAYTWAETTRRYFGQWYEVVRDARAAMMSAAAAGDVDAATVLTAIKQVYTRTVGRLARVDDGRAKSPLYRPDWRLAIVSTANVNLLRKLRRAGMQADMWPVALSTDEVLYLSDEPDPRKAIPQPLRLSPEGGVQALGEFKVARTAAVTDGLRAVLAGGKLGDILHAVPKSVRGEQ